MSEVQGTTIEANAYIGSGVILKEATELVPETLLDETLSDEVQTRAVNNTSVICLLEVDDRKLLFTGDAGIPALDNAADVLEATGFQAGDLNFVQIPHHGSKRNVGPSILDRLLGDKGQQVRASTAFVSAPKKNPEHKHPAKKVTNAFYRRGYNVHATQGTIKMHSNDAPLRPDYSASTPVPFYLKVEDSVL